MMAICYENKPHCNLLADYWHHLSSKCQNLFKLYHNHNSQNLQFYLSVIEVFINIPHLLKKPHPNYILFSYLRPLFY